MINDYDCFIYTIIDYIHWVVKYRTHKSISDY